MNHPLTIEFGSRALEITSEAKVSVAYVSIICNGGRYDRQ